MAWAAREQQQRQAEAKPSAEEGPPLPPAPPRRAAAPPRPAGEKNCFCNDLLNDNLDKEEEVSDSLSLETAFEEDDTQNDLTMKLDQDHDFLLDIEEITS